jgi:hypothetical protein
MGSTEPVGDGDHELKPVFGLVVSLNDWAPSHGSRLGAAPHSTLKGGHTPGIPNVSRRSLLDSAQCDR